MTINVAIAGTGRIADSQLAPAIRQTDGAQLWSVLSRDRERALAFAARHNAQAPQPACTDIHELLADSGLDALVIAMPDKLHARATIAAARAGKHVLVEKPMATDMDSGRAMIQACREAGVILAVAYHLRWHDGHRRAVAAVHAGQLGALRHMRVLWSGLAADASNWRASAEVGRWWSLAGVGTHCLDLIRWVMLPSCGEIQRLKSVITRPVWNGPHDELAVLTLEFASGATAQLCSSVLFRSPSRLEIYGSNGYVLCTGTLGPHGAGSVTTHDGPLAFNIVNPYAGEIQDFVDAVQQGREPEVDGCEGLRNVELLLESVSEAGLAGR